MSVIPEQIQAPVGSEPAAPVVPNFDDFSLDDLQAGIQAVREARAAIPPVPAAPIESAPAEEPKTQEPVVEPAAEEPKVEEPEAEEAKADAAAEPVAEAFKFTENADFETLEKEAAAYFETIEEVPELNTIVAGYKAEIERLKAQPAPEPAELPVEIAALGSTETLQKTMAAINKLVEFRQDDAGALVPDTRPLLELLKTDYAQEYEQVVHDITTAPSTKYPGMTALQEWIKDVAGLDDRGMKNLQTLMTNRGELPAPNFTPQGIDPRVAEAYWHAPNRLAMEDTLDRCLFVIDDLAATPEEKQVAQNEINGLNQQLAMAQRGLEAEKQAKQQMVESRQKAFEAVQADAMKGYVDTSVTMLRAFSDKVSKSLDMFDDAGAKLTATAYTTLVEKALADDDWSKYAQEDLASQGITFDWKKGRETLDRLFEVEVKLAHAKSVKASPRVTEIATREKAAILRELKGMETDLMGRIARVAVKGAGKALEQKVEAAPKLKVVKPRAAAAASVDASKVSYDDIPLEKLQSMMGEARRRAAAEGVMLP